MRFVFLVLNVLLVLAANPAVRHGGASVPPSSDPYASQPWWQIC
jgi:hypothetical protein